MKNIFMFNMDSDSAWEAIIRPLIVWTVTIVTIVFLADYFYGKNIGCPQLGNSLQKEVKYNYLAGGCFIKLSNGNWISSDSYAGVNVENK